jgi:2-polyprenyl-3-methyl-5-hydroxy-6-metoxy-1,4-benzoquinol methylase
VAWDAHFSDRDLESLAGLGFQAVREQPRGPFDAVLLLDVLEHVEDDRGFLW